MRQACRLPLSGSHISKNTCDLSRENIRTSLSGAPGTAMEHFHIADHIYAPRFFFFFFTKREYAEYRHLSLFIPRLLPPCTCVIKYIPKP